MAIDFSKYGEPIDAKTGVAKDAIDFSKYGTPIGSATVPGQDSTKPGLFQSFVQGVSSPFLRTAVTGAEALGIGIDLFKSIGAKISGKDAEAQAILDQSRAETERRKKEGYNFGYFGQIKPLQNVKEGIGAGLEMGSYLVGGTGAVKTVGTGLRDTIIQGIKTGVKSQIPAGALMGAGSEMQKSDSTAGDILKGAIVSGATAGVAGGVLGGATPFATKVANSFTKQALREDLGAIYRQTASKYVKPQAILENAEMVNKTDPVAVLQMYGKNTLPEMAGNGASTMEGQEFLKKKIADLSKLRNEDLFLNDSRVTFDEYRAYTNDLIDAQSWSASKKVLEKQQANKILNQIEAGYKGSPKYQNGLELNELGLIKTEQTALSKAYNNSKSTFSYDAHGILGKSAREIVEKVSDSETTKELNKLIQSHYDAIDFLQALEGKKIHGGALSKMFMKLSGDIVGMSVGQSLGHPILGTAIGHVISNKISNVVQSRFISNPVKRLLIQNLGEQAPREAVAVLKKIEQKNNDIFLEMGLDKVQSSLSKKTKLTPSNTTITNNKSPNSIKVNNTVTGETSMIDLSSKANKEPTKIVPDASLKGKDAKVQEKAIAKLEADRSGMLKKYISENNKVINTDEARKLFTDVGYNGINARAVHEPSSALAKDAWYHLLDTAEEPDILIYAGGSGTGKTSAVKNFLPKEIERAGAILDGNLSSLPKANERIREVVNAGKNPTVVYVYREPVDAWVNGVVKRMKSNASEKGRVVTLSTFLDNHKGSWEVTKALMKDKGAGKKFNIKLVDNSLGAGKQALLTPEKFAKISYSDKLKQTLLSETKKLLKKKKITKEQYDELIK